MAGEAGPDRGREGVQRAKQWLDLTTRVETSWINTHRILGNLIHFEWPGATGTSKPFSFDMGGWFRGAPIAGQSFVAEVKNYKSEMGLGAEFLDFLAKCYIALISRREQCDNFLWISWSPFQAQKWDQHATTANVRKALTLPRNRKRALGVDKPTEVMAQLDMELASEVAKRIWLITLSAKQEMLVPIEDHYFKVKEMIDRERGLL